jgi:hypothetical protein
MSGSCGTLSAAQSSACYYGRSTKPEGVGVYDEVGVSAIRFAHNMSAQEHFVDFHLKLSHFGG